MPAQLPDEPVELPPFTARIFIDEDGSVVFENLDEGLLEIARELDPDASFACDVELESPDTD